MNAIAQRQVPQQLSAATRAGVAVAAFAVIACGVIFAADASEHAVRNAQAALSPAIRYVVLPAVEVIAKKQSAEMADGTCTAAQARI